MNGIQGKVIVITGASSGFGEATATALAEKGAKVVLAARREDRLKILTGSIQRSGGEAAYCQSDVTSREQMKALADFAVKQFGTIDVWINNAGIMPLSFFDKLRVDEWDQVIDINIKGVLYGIAAALPVMTEHKRGHIINISSMAGQKVGLGIGVYSATKFAVNAITEGLRMELSPRSNIRATVITPGAANTELRNTITDPDVLRMLDSRPIQDRLEAKDIANAIVYAIEQPEYVSVSHVIVRPTQALR